MIGVDEAGRGPVIGSMFVACVDADESALPDTIRDSKQLTNTRVRELGEQIINHPETRVIAREITATHIDTTTKSLTTVTADVMRELVETCLTHHTKHENEDEDEIQVVVDAGHSNADTYRNMIVDNLDYDTTNTSVRAEHRADENHPVVSAAGIVAKTLRETHINELHENGVECGSGYPSDPTTTNYVKSIVEADNPLPPFVRTSWSTVQELQQQANQTTMTDFDT